MPDTQVDGDAEAEKDAAVCVDIGNAMLRAKNRDPVAAALGLLTLAAALVDGNAAGRTAVALQMIRVGAAMDPDVARVHMQ